MEFRFLLSNVRNYLETFGLTEFEFGPKEFELDGGFYRDFLLVLLVGLKHLKKFWD